MRASLWISGLLLAGLGGCTAGVSSPDAFVDPSDGEGAAMLLTALSKDASPDDCPNGGVVLSQGIDRNFNGLLDEEEVLEELVLCHGRMARRASPARRARTPANAA